MKLYFRDEKFKKQVLESILKESAIKDPEYWKETIEREYAEAEKRAKDLGSDYSVEDYGHYVEDDVTAFLELWDDNA